MLTRRAPFILAAIMLAAASFITDAFGQSYPSRRITMVIPFPAGGPHDVIARPLAQELSKNIGQPVIIENRNGAAGGMLGTREVARADPDGYTLLFGSVSTQAIAPALYKDPGFDPLTSFAPVAEVSREPLILVAAHHMKERTLADMIARAKAEPGKLSYAAATGTNMLFVPYKGGAPALTDTLGDQVDLLLTTTSIVTPHIRAGRLTGLALMSEERVPQLPDIPTMRESAFDVSAYFWTGVLAPKGTPAPVVARFNGEIYKSLASPDVRNAILNLSSQPKGGTPEEFMKLITAEVEKWPAVVKASGTQVY